MNNLQQSEKYAVLEWRDGNDEIAHIIVENETKEIAEMFVKIAPPHLPRQIVTMSEISEIDRL